MWWADSKKEKRMYIVMQWTAAHGVHQIHIIMGVDYNGGSDGHMHVSVLVFNLLDPLPSSSSPLFISIFSAVPMCANADNQLVNKRDLGDKSRIIGK